MPQLMLLNLGTDEAPSFYPIDQIREARYQPKRPAKWIGFGIGLGVDVLIVGAFLAAALNGLDDMKFFEADQQRALSR